MTLTKFEINDICNVVLEPHHTQLKKSNELLERIAVALEQKDSMENLLSETEKEFLKGNVVRNNKPIKSKGEIMGEITRKYINKFNKKFNKEKK
jgi:hypothetical protein